MGTVGQWATRAWNYQGTKDIERTTQLDDTPRQMLLGNHATFLRLRPQAFTLTIL